MSSAESAVVNILAIVACLGAAIMIPLTYGVIPALSDSFAPAVAWLIANGIWGALAYAVFTVLAGMSPQTHPRLYNLAHLASFIAWASINITAGIVVYQMYRNGQQVHKLADIPDSMRLLIGVLAISWLDIVWFQRHKHKELLLGTSGQHDAAVSVRSPLATQLNTGTGASSVPAPADLLQQLAVAARVIPNTRIGPLKAFVEVDTAGNAWMAFEELPQLTLSPAPAAATPAAP